MLSFQKIISTIKSKVNYELLLIKLHYILYWGGGGCSAQFVSLIAKDVGLSTTTIGITNGISSITLMLSQPGFGSLCDRFKNDKYVMMFLTMVSAITLFSLVWIPRLPNIDTTNEIIVNNNTDHYVYCDLHFPNNGSRLKYNSTCNFICLDEKVGNGSWICINNETKTEFSHKYSSSNYRSFSMLILSDTNFIICNFSTIECSEDQDDEYRTIYIWTFSVIGIFCQIILFTGYGLSDSICQRVLKDDYKSEFGKQKFWSSCSYGVGTLTAGYLNDAVKSQKYKIGFFIMLVAYFLDCIVLYKLPHMDTNTPKFEIKKLKHIFASVEIIFFTIGVFVIGVITSISWNYTFILLESLNASQLLLGIIIFCQYIFADCLFYALSGLIISRIGYVPSLIISFAAFATRYLLLSFIINPWYALPIEMLEGVTFALFLVNFLTFAKEKSPPGLEFTMVGVLFSAFQGIGIAIGSFLFGLGFDRVGMRITCRIASGISVFFGLIFTLYQIISHLTKRKELKVNK